RHGFDHRQRDAFTDAGQQEEVGSAQESPDISALAEESNLRRQLTLLDQTTNLAALGPIADYYQLHIRMLLTYVLEHPNGRGVAFQVIEARHHKDHDVACLHADLTPNGLAFSSVGRE